MVSMFQKKVLLFKMNKFFHKFKKYCDLFAYDGFEG